MRNFNLSTFTFRLIFKNQIRIKKLLMMSQMQPMKTRGNKVDAQPKSAKTLFPWRDLVKGRIAKTVLVKHVLVAKLHLLKGTTNVGEK